MNTRSDDDVRKLVGSQETRCQANVANTAGGNDPQDCNWPLCGCDSHAEKVIETLNESGFYVVPGTATPEMVSAGYTLPCLLGRLCREDIVAIYEAMVERSQKP